MQGLCGLSSTSSLKHIYIIVTLAPRVVMRAVNLVAIILVARLERDAVTKLRGRSEQDDSVLRQQESQVCIHAHGFRISCSTSGLISSMSVWFHYNHRHNNAKLAWCSSALAQKIPLLATWKRESREQSRSGRL